MDESTHDASDDARTSALARALASPLRLRILRLCLFDARTNRELADLLDLNPGTCLHHVRTLVDAGLLAAQEKRRGARGAVEIPYLATRASWRASIPHGSSVLIETMLQQIAPIPDDDVHVIWLGLRLNPDHHRELEERLASLAEEFKERGADSGADAEAYSLVVVVHPDLNPAPGEE